MAARPHKPFTSSPPRSLSASKASGGAGVRWSTSSLPRADAKHLNAPDFSAIAPGIRMGRTAAPVKERKSLDGPRAPQARSSGGPLEWSKSKLNTLPKKTEENPGKPSHKFLKLHAKPEGMKENDIVNVAGKVSSTGNVSSNVRISKGKDDLAKIGGDRKSKCYTAKKKPDASLSKPTSVHVNSQTKGRKSNGILDAKLEKTEAGVANCKADCDPHSKSTDVEGPSKKISNLLVKENETHVMAVPESGSNESKGKEDLAKIDGDQKSKCYTAPKKPDASLSKPKNMHVNSQTKILQGRKAIEILHSNFLKLGHKLIKNEAAAADCKADCDQCSKSRDVKGPSKQYTNLLAKETGTDVIVAPELGSNELINAVDDCCGKPQLDAAPIENETRADVKKDDEGSEWVHVASRNQSKIHETLSLLMGKVQKIALDIQQTKEMLDESKTDDSALILSELQSKIFSVEKAVGKAMPDRNLSERSGENKAAPDREELEARFFPHQRFMRSRENQEQCRENGDHIALEFPVSLDCKQPENKTSAVIRPKDDAALSIIMVSGRGSPVHNAAKATVERVHEIDLMANEKLDDIFDDENKQVKMFTEQIEESRVDQLFEIGQKATTAGWFVSEGEAALLAHSDGSCSYYDITNNEEKSLYKPPVGVSKNLWGDCWLIRAQGGDGCSGRYVVAASAGYTSEPGFCSWDFYTKAITAFRAEEDGRTNSFQISWSRTPLAPLSNRELSRRTTPAVAAQQWWYTPCGPLIISASSKQKSLSSYDIRDGGFVMKWDVGSFVSSMEYSSPLQWRSKDKLVVAEVDAIALWDVSSLQPLVLQSASPLGKRIHAMHVHNIDAELGGGVRQRVSSSEVEGKDGVFCTQDSIGVLDFRLPSGIGQMFSRTGHAAQSIFYTGNNVFLGCTESRLSLKNSTNSFIEQYSMQMGKMIASYALTSSNSHLHYSSITQVWGSSRLVMGCNGGGLFVFDVFEHDSCSSNASSAREIIGPDDLYLPTFDHHGSRVLLVSRDRPAVWKYL